jgi:uncharacterized membrane protein
MENFSIETLTSSGGILALVLGVLALFFTAKNKSMSKNKAAREAVSETLESLAQKEINKIEQQEKTVKQDINTSELKSVVVGKQVELKVDNTVKELQEDVKRTNVTDITDSIKSKWENI